MKLRTLQIKNFRGIRDLTLPLDDVTVLIGENNTGKTSILDALQICLSRAITRRAGTFGDYDYHLNSADCQPTDADSIEITLYFQEDSPDEWPEAVPQLVPDAIGVGADDKQRVILRVASVYDKALSTFTTTWTFLNPAGESLAKANNPRNLSGLQQLVPIFYLAALRDAAQEFRPRSQFWGPFVRALKIDPALRKEIEDELAVLNQKVLDSHEAFEPVRERLKQTGKLVPLHDDDPVGIEALPGKVFDMLSRTQVMLSAKTGARLPISQHGEGTQSLAVICLFDAFLSAQLTESYSEHADPILALEEPEAHLHPSAIRAVGKLLTDMRGQKIIATHSGDLVASVPVTALRRLCRREGRIVVHQVLPGSLTPEDIRKLDHHIRLSRGNLLFARYWLLVEGETDSRVFQECARLCGSDLFSEGICCIEYATIGLERFIKLGDQLGIVWSVIADDDPEGSKYKQTAVKMLAGRKEVDHVRLLPARNMESFLCQSGYGAVYEKRVSPQKAGTIVATKGTVAYWDQVVRALSDKGKPEAAAACIDEIEKIGAKGVPDFIRQAIDAALAAARKAS